jgi:hypothetical protein
MSKVNLFLHEHRGEGRLPSSSDIRARHLPTVSSQSAHAGIFDFPELGPYFFLPLDMLKSPGRIMPGKAQDY